MRIVLLITMGLERPSGVRYFAIARELVRQGHRVRILALHPDLPACAQRRFVRDGVEVWYVGQMHARKSATHPQRFSPLALLRVLLLSTLGMIWGVVCSPADVYHLGKPQPINGVAALVGVMLLRGQRFWVDCDDDETTSNRFTARWQQHVFAWWQWLLPRLAAGVTVNTQFLAERMRRAGVRRVVLVPNGVDLRRFKPPPASTIAALRQALGLAEQQVITYVGTLALHNHPVDLLLAAFAQIAYALPRTTLLLVGGGEDLPLLRQQASDWGLRTRVRFTGHVPPHAVPAYLALADVSVDPVHDDAVARARSPLKLWESMALGVPVVTGAVGDRAAALHDGQAGVLVSPGDVHALADGLSAILHDDHRRAALAQAGRQQMQHYTWQRLAVRWATVYET